MPVFLGNPFFEQAIGHGRWTHGRPDNGSQVTSRRILMNLPLIVITHPNPIGRSSDVETSAERRSRHLE